MRKGKENLRVLSPEEARRNGRKGGLASAAARKKKKTIRETLMALRDMPVEDSSYKTFLKKNGVADNEMTYGVLISMSIIKGAFRGNSQMTQLLLKSLGELDADKLEVTGKDGAPLPTAPAVTVYLPDNGR